MAESGRVAGSALADPDPDPVGGSVSPPPCKLGRHGPIPLRVGRLGAESADFAIHASSWWCYFARRDLSPECFIPEQQREGRVDIFYA
ncbi:hypothetical protein Taro_013695 [Colocasia esculenta]|uniref:Uncharacterized protein n=1 Tax=Colocasia esculenta TaxID=4460 RepID=A0A843UG99_COLES|nr:hypothetical protein [Colocasia esculenta]